MKTCTCGEVKRAMEKSIAKWERVVNQGVDGCGAKECGLCDCCNYRKFKPKEGGDKCQSQSDGQTQQKCRVISITAALSLRQAQ